jgi:hypothetical protein
MMRVRLPGHLQTLAQTGAWVELPIVPPCSINQIIDALELQYPQIGGATRDRITRRRRAFVRFFCAGEDVSDWDPDRPLPMVGESLDFEIVGAIAGG